ncbi:MAG: hypothetical protein Kow00109_07030 [Acidobacteriota bacterium]
MTYRVIARKWRPQRFGDIVGQEAVVKTLQNALATGRIAHAFLFSGVRGVGKTTTARILAKALNCHQGVSPEPCNACPSCEEITEGNAIDVLEIDAASNRGIDSIRELRESVRFGTARDRFKIYIVDEVHMLTNEAFNALLKTLEEPPSHVKFILATTELQKIPATIASRCQRFEFKPIPFRLIQERLRLICREEGIEMSDYALAMVAAAGRGSMRDAQSALDQLIAFAGERISDEDVRILLGVSDQAAVGVLLDAVRRRDRGEVVRGLRTLLDSGLSPQLVAQDLVEHVRNLLVCKVAGWDAELLRLPDSQRDSLERQAGEFTELELIRLYDVLQRTAADLRWQVQPEYHLELGLLKLVEVAGLARIEEVLERLLEPGAGGVAAPPRSAEPPRTARKPAPTGGEAPAGGSAVATRPDPQPPADPAAGGGRREAGTAGSATDWKERFSELFTELKAATSIELEGNRLRVRFPKTQAFPAAVLERRRADVVKTCSELVGQAVADVKIEFEAVRQEKEAPKPEGKEVLNDPRVKEFLKRFPGRAVIKKQP